MCTTCGCATGNVKIEGEEHHHHEHDHQHLHDHQHDQEHSHQHGQEHSHDHKHGHQHQHQQSVPGTVIEHHYHGTTHIHYHVNANQLGSVLDQVTAEKNVVPADAHSEETDSTFAEVVAGDDLHFGKGAAHSHAPGMSQARMVKIEQDILGKNNAIANKNRQFFASRNIKVLNLVSSPGSGKTTLLTNTLSKLNRDTQRQIAVIEGDQQTANDAERIRATGVRAIQVNTGKGCHLDAQMIGSAVARLDLGQDSLLFIENVGNLVCPASFDLGEQAKVAILSVTEGEDKPLKYPDMFHAASLMIINKIDLLPYVDFDIDNCIGNAKTVNPDIEVILLSAKSDEGMHLWLNYLKNA